MTTTISRRRRRRKRRSRKGGGGHLEIEIGRMSTVRTKIVPVIIGALGTIKKALHQSLQLFPGHPSAIELRR